MRTFAVALAALLLAAGPGGAGPGPRHEQGGRELGDIIISAAERALIRDYYQRNPGMGGGPLPPGIQKKVARGKPLPPGIAKNFPGALRAQLKPRPGYDYAVVGADVVLAEAATGVIVEVIRDILK